MVRLAFEYLTATAARIPDKTALVDGKKTLTFGEWLDGAERIGGKLAGMGVFRQPVAVYMNKSAENLVAFLGIAMSGNFYTVIDTRMPRERVSRIFSTLKPAVVLADSANLEKAREACAELPEARVMTWEEMTAETPDRDALRKASEKVIDTDLLYVFFTSGSTGMPKGVTINHRSVVNYTEWASEELGFSQETVFGNQAPFYFDISVQDIYCTLRCGSTLHLIPRMLFSFPIRLLEYIRDNRLTDLYWVPTVLSSISNLDLLDKCDVSCLRMVMAIGEVLPTKCLNYWMRHLPGTRFANLYGPTEATVACTYYLVDRKLDDSESVPIGKGCRNTDILILNSENRPVTGDEKGELCVRGTSLSFGYYGDPEKTASAFVQNPLNTLYEEKIYRTGDIAHYNERGEILFDGRMDSQVKHTGHRIELGEIDTAVSSMEGIERCCCLHQPEGDRLVLFYAGNKETADIRKEAARLLPDYMLPNVCVRMDSLPINMNGKIDRVALKHRMNEMN